MKENVICEKCGSVMGPIVPDKPVGSIGMECPKCGWGWATTYIEPKYEDETVYKVVLDRGSDATKENIKVIASIMNCNYLRAKEVIADAGFILAEGKAAEIEESTRLLLRSSIKYYIEPEWPY
ncbi:MAG: hypothetical protein IKA24_06255 [Mogibacterium sp.]|nr:hypothetical protein [Mogibacterium sp.]